jgi:exodeoxyribonuclease V alpha subunit
MCRSCGIPLPLSLCDKVGPNLRRSREVIAQGPWPVARGQRVGPKLAERIIAGWAEQKIIREIMPFLHSNGVGAPRGTHLCKTDGTDRVQLISENPYRLARGIRGVGLRAADHIAAELGLGKTALTRLRAEISCGARRGDGRR